MNTIGSNVQAKVEGNKLVLTIDLSTSDAPVSKSGKSRLVASTGSFAQIPGAPAGFRIQANVIKPL
jgi:hypothetical protein